MSRTYPEDFSSRLLIDEISRSVPIGRKDAETAFRSGKVEAICDALVRLAYHDSDWRFVQGRCLEFLKHENPDVRGLAATCLGHLARIHGTLDLQFVKPLLTALVVDSEFGR